VWIDVNPAVEVRAVKLVIAANCGANEVQLGHFHLRGCEATSEVLTDPGAAVGVLDDGVAIAARPNGFQVLPEYSCHLRDMCVVPEPMESCALSSKLKRLAEAPEQPGSAEDVIAEFVRVAFGLTSNRAARSHCGTSLVAEGFVSFFSDSVAYLRGLSWEYPLLLAALRHLISKPDVEDMQIVCGLMCRAARECTARKRFVFNSVVSRCYADEPSSVANVIGDPAGSAQERIRTATSAIVDDMKLKAAQTTFYEPLMAYCSVYDYGVALDADVHGTSTFLAMLMVTTGIRTGRMPSWHDEAKGVVDVLAAGMGHMLECTLWRPEALGVPWSACGPLKTRLREDRLRLVPENTLVWSCGGRSTSEFTALAINPSPRNAALRSRFAAYVQQFTSYFTPAVLIPRLFAALTSDDGRLADLNTIATAKGLLPEGIASVNEAVWDLEQVPAVFNQDAAWRILAACGVVYTSEQMRAGPNAEAAAQEPPRSTTTSRRFATAKLPAGVIRLTAAGDIRGGGTGREVLANLLLDGKEPWNKWLHPGTRCSWVLAEFTSPWIVTSVGLCSANDFPERDPARFDVEVQLIDGSWRRLHTQSRCPFTHRWEWVWIDLQPTQARAVKLVIHSNGGAGQIQLGHFHIRGAQDPTPTPLGLS
jgi:hypothetical protein